MTLEIGFAFGILAFAVVLFVSERVRADVVALIVLVLVVVTGLVEPREALIGFSNPAVVTVWAVFILSGGLASTGVAGWIGHHVLRLAGRGEARLVFLIMLTAGVLSGFMNNVGVAALMLPVVMDIAKRTGRAPSRLLIPLSYSCLLGGLTTLIGTPPNLLVSEALRTTGQAPFGLFDFTPVGGIVLLAGITFMALIGRRMLPDRGVIQPRGPGLADLSAHYGLGEALSFVDIPPESPLEGMRLDESRVGSALDLNVMAIVRRERTIVAPGPDTLLQAGDRLLVEGELDQLSEISGRHYLSIEDAELPVERLASADIQVAEVTVVAPASVIGQTLRDIGFRQRYGLIVLAARRDERLRRTRLERLAPREGDVLLVQGPPDRIERLGKEPGFKVERPRHPEQYHLEEKLLIATVPDDSVLAGESLIDTQLGETYGIGVLGVVRDGGTRLMPDPHEELCAGDTLLLRGTARDLAAVQGLQGLEVESEAPDPGKLEAVGAVMAEAVVSPRAVCVGQTLRELNFRERFGLTVVALSRAGRVHRSGIGDLALRFGDALLLYGPRKGLGLLSAGQDCIVMTEAAHAPPRTDKAPLAILFMGAMVLSVITGLLPIYIAAVAAAVLMVLTGCLTMDQAYRSIEWRAVFLIAGMLPLGLAMQESGAASFVTERVVSLIEGGGPLTVVAGIYLVTAIGAQVMPTSAVAILMAPVALAMAGDMNLSPHAVLMTVALAASASFMSPVAHPANVLIMGPGGYRFRDYTRVGLPLTIVCLIVVLLVLPLIWPLQQTGTFP
jgi:di/tricarboxylate transporter